MGEFAEDCIKTAVAGIIVYGVKKVLDPTLDALGEELRDLVRPNFQPSRRRARD